MDDGLKQRIVGAIVLFAIAMVFVPVLFDRERIAPVDRTTQIPLMPLPIVTPASELASTLGMSESDENVLDHGDTAINDEPQVTQTNADVSAPRNTHQGRNASVTSTTPAPQFVEEKDAVSLRDRVKSPDKIFLPDDKQPQSLQNEAPGLAANGTPKSWVLQFASYENKVRALKIRDQLIADGHRAYTRDVNTAEGKRVRVYIGPSLDKSTILTAKAAVDQKYNVSALVLTFKP